MDLFISILFPVLLLGALLKTPRPYLTIWAFATPVFFLIFGFKSIFVNVGFTSIELFSGVLPVLVVAVAYSKLTPTERKRAWKYSPKIWIIFLVFYAVSLVWSNNISTGSRTVSQLILPSVLYVVAFNLIQSDFHIEQHFKWLMLINLIIVVVDTYVATTYWHIVQAQGALNQGAVGYRTVTSYFYVTMATLLLVRLIDQFNIWFLLVLLLDLAMIVLSASRTPFFVFLAGAGVGVLYQRKVKVAASGSIILLAALLLILLLPSKNKFIAEDDSLNMKDSGREFFQEYFRKKADERPLLGWGAGGSETYATWISQNITPVGAPHNEYLRVRFDLGYVGLCLFILGLVEMLIRGLWMGRWLKNYSALKSVLVMTPVMFAVSATNDNTFFYFYVFTNYLFIVMGFAARLAYEERVALGQEDLVLSEHEHDIVLEGESQPRTV